jgi:hypothetical protein
MRSVRIISGWRSAGFKTGSEFQGIESREERTGKEGGCVPFDVDLTR